MKRLLHIALLLLLAVSCGPRKIPRADMEEILSQMLLQDQQIKMDPALRRAADTSLVYEGIFEAYGYDTDDFLYSLEYYLADPARMEKIMGKVAEGLEKDSRELNKEIRLQDWRDGFLRIYGRKVDTTRRPRPRVRPADTLRVRFDNDSVWLYKRDSIGMRELDTLMFHPSDSL